MYKYKDKNNQAIEFFIPKECKKIGVQCSGGADSSLILYLTLKYLEEKNRHDTEVIVITGGCLTRKPYPLYASKVINYLREYFNTDRIKRHYIAYPSEANRGPSIHAIEQRLKHNGETDIVIFGTTMNPQEDIIVNNNNNPVNLRTHYDAAPRRQQPQPIWFSATTNHPINYFPLHQVDKRMSAHIYEVENMMDLYNITYSCENVISTGFYSSMCGNCWWCLERKWAFGRL